MKHLKLFLIACFLLLLSGFIQAQLVGKHTSEYSDFYKYAYKDTLSGNIKRYECLENTHPYFVGLQTLSVQDGIILQYTFGMGAKHAIPQCTKLVQNIYYEIQKSLLEGCILHKTNGNKDIYNMPNNIEVILYYTYENGKNAYTMCSTLK